MLQSGNHEQDIDTPSNVPTTHISKMWHAVIRASRQLVNRLAQQQYDSHIKKHHWIIGGLIMFVCGWITHTTTAAIAEENRAQGFANLVTQGNHPNTVDLFSEDVETKNVDHSQVASNVPTLTTPLSPLREVRHTVKKGETLGIIFKRKKLGLTIAHHISQHPIAKKLTQLSVGKELRFQFNQSNSLKELSYPLNALQELQIKIDGNNLGSVEIIDLPYTTLQHQVSAEISSNLYEAALEAGLSNNLIMEMVRIFGWDVDFAQDIRVADTFHVIYSDYNLEGKKLADGNILAAEFITQGHVYRAIRYQDESGAASYYTPEGESMLGTFLRSPVEFSRISSRFGKRKHPILKKWRSHKGVDYAARRGTPIRATADGKVILAGAKGGYGKTVVLRHAGRFSTLYGHMNGFAKKVRSGQRVKQGQVIGYIGSTGLATGPHLHYEFRVDGVHRNPLTYKTPKASSIAPSERNSFDQRVDHWLAKLNLVSGAHQLAQQASDEEELL